MKVLVCGGRMFKDVNLLSATLDNLHKIYNFTEIIHGAARGADIMAATWAHKNRIKTRAFQPDWVAQGKAAGHLRNKHMLDVGKPELVIAFPGNTGTEHMIFIALEKGITVIRAGDHHCAA